MYKKDRVFVIIIFFGALTIFSLLGISYRTFAQYALTVNSISFAVYIAAASALLGSEYASDLKKKVDLQIPTKTQLGVLSSYLKYAGNITILSIIISSIYCLPYSIEGFAIVKSSCSVIAYIVFSLSIFYLYLVFKLLISSMIKSAS